MIDGLRKRTVLRQVLLMSVYGIAFCVFLYSPIINGMFSFLEVQPQIKKSEAIILLSSGNYTSEIFEEGTYQRMFHALKLYTEGYGDKIYICGGIVSKDTEPISILMKQFLVSLGVSEDAIITETESLDTYENIRNVIPLLKEDGITESLLVTSSSHMLRSSLISKKLGLTVFPAPVPCYEKDLVGLVVKSRFLYQILREYGALVYFKLLGRI